MNADEIDFRSTDEALQVLAMLLWPNTYGNGFTDKQVWTECQRSEWTSRDPGQTASAAGASIEVERFMFAAKWADSGYPKITTTHKYAAALASTKLDREFAEDLHIPGKAFLVAVPNGIFEVPFVASCPVPQDQRGHVRDYDRIAVATYEVDGTTRAVMMLLDRYTCGGMVQMLFHSTLADLLFDEVGEIESAHELVVNESVQKRRVALLARRLVVGLLLAMRDTANFVEKPASRARSDGRGPPQHRIMFVGRPIDVDCRPALKEFVGGGRETMPSVQTLVRGHHKRQVVGVGRNGRRVIWVEPYWRGPEDAPILARPLRIGGT